MQLDLSAVPLDLPADLGARAEEFLSFLEQWNRRINLVSRQMDRVGLERQFLSSLAPLSLIQEAEVRFLDLGSGGGMPALPLLMARPSWTGVLVESIQKKCSFLEEALGRFAPGRSEVVGMRFGEWLPDPGSLGHVTIRAVKLDAKLARALAASMRTGGRLLIYAPSGEGERAELLQGLERAGFSMAGLETVDWADSTIVSAIR